MSIRAITKFLWHMSYGHGSSPPVTYFITLAIEQNNSRKYFFSVEVINWEKEKYNMTCMVQALSLS